MSVFIGVDPGKQGGIAFLDGKGAVLRTAKMPATEMDLWIAFQPAVNHTVPVHAYIERVHSSPQMGVTSAFTFGKGYGLLLMALTAAGIPFAEVTPQSWQKAIGCLTKGDKNVSKRKAQQLFPKETVTHAIADALLIAEYCRRIHEGHV